MPTTRKDRVLIVMPPDLVEVLKKRAEDSQRSYNMEIVWIVREFLKQEHAHESAKKV